jgi:MFS transporter, DHA2 family, multidrug resistance protein
MWPRVLQVLGVGLTTVPLSTIMFRFLPKDQSSNAAGIYALVRNEGGSIGIAAASTFLQRMTQVHQAYLSANITSSNMTALAMANTLGGAAGGSIADAHYSGLALLYGQLQRQAQLLAYMDQYRLCVYVLLSLLVFLLLLKRPPKQTEKIELDAH